MSDPNDMLRSANSILLVDWASPSVPRTLVVAGFNVFCASPGRYSVVEVVPESPQGVDSSDIIPPQPGEQGYLVFRRLNERPAKIDIINVYRPESEHTGIVANQVVPLRRESDVATTFGLFCDGTSVVYQTRIRRG
jgi:predicted CoA-binding protein